MPSYVENGNEEPVEKCDTEARVGRSPPRGREWGGDKGDLTPVEGENTHSKTMGSPKKLVDLGVVWSYPANP